MQVTATQLHRIRHKQEQEQSREVSKVSLSNVAKKHNDGLFAVHEE